MRRLRYLIWLLWIWWFPCPLEAATLTVESSSAQGALELTDGEGNACALVSVDANSVVDGPWVLTELELAYWQPDAPGKLRIALPPRAIPIDRAFAPKLEQTGGNVWER